MFIQARANSHIKTHNPTSSVFSTWFILSEVGTETRFAAADTVTGTESVNGLQAA